MIRKIGFLAICITVVGLFAMPALAEKGPAGEKFKFFGTGHDGSDPQNPTNYAVSITISNGTDFGGIVRKVNPGNKASDLTDQLQLKYYLQNMQCGGGSPRIQLGIDTTGDGHFDGNAFGYVGDKPWGGQGDCPMNQWVLEDMTDNVAKWDLTQLGGGGAITWSEAVAYLATKYPNYKVLNIVYVLDSGWLGSLFQGVTFLDNVVGGNQAVDNKDDMH